MTGSSDEAARNFAPSGSSAAAQAASVGGSYERDADLRYAAACTGTPATFSLTREGGPTLVADDAADFLYLLEQDLIVELQKRRADLFFLHSAAVEWQGGAYLLVAESGAGKSTTAWALLHDGFGYLSDELAPVDLDSMQVLPYAHALCLKERPAAYPLPPGALDLGRTLHIPVHALPGAAIVGPVPLAAIFVLTRRPSVNVPELRVVGIAEAAARLYATSLNALAHANRGLDAVMRIASHAPTYVLTPGDLQATCTLVRTVVERASSGKTGVAGSSDHR